jgi:hypothetical protein
VSLSQELNFGMESHRNVVESLSPDKRMEKMLRSVLDEKGFAEVQNLEAAFWTLLLQEPWGPKWHILKTVRFSCYAS